MLNIYPRIENNTNLGTLDSHHQLQPTTHRLNETSSRAQIFLGYVAFPTFYLPPPSLKACRVWDFCEVSRVGDPDVVYPYGHTRGFTHSSTEVKKEERSQPYFDTT
jgi:hypothetical protein